jgi:transposase
MTAPGVGWLVGFSFAAEIGDIKRFSSPRKAVWPTGKAARASETPRR